MCVGVSLESAGSHIAGAQEMVVDYSRLSLCPQLHHTHLYPGFLSNEHTAGAQKLSPEWVIPIEERVQRVSPWPASNTDSSVDSLGWCRSLHGFWGASQTSVEHWKSSKPGSFSVSSGTQRAEFSCCWFFSMLAPTTLTAPKLKQPVSRKLAWIRFSALEWFPSWNQPV